MYDAMLAAQGGVCAICGRPETRPAPNGQPSRLHVDHNHSTGLVRGLLCNNCNQAIGKMGDDPDRLITAAEYLRRG